MKARKFIFIVFALIGMVFSALAENEPNNTWQTANEITVGSSTTCSIGINGDEDDWYKITLPKDGKLIFWGIPEPTLDITLNMTDENGTS
jgi:hypothetical protein